MLRLPCVTVMVVLLMLVPSPKMYAKTASVQALIDQEESWMANLQVADGGVPMNRGSSGLNPYFANLGMMGIVDNPAYDQTVRRWITWYIEHLNRPDVSGVYGSIYDHEMWYGMYVPNRKYDSTDSYASTFLNLVRAYHDTSGDTAFLLELKEDLTLVAGAIYATMDKADYLTFSQPSMRAKYLMDNAQVYLGLVDWAYIQDKIYDDPEGAKQTTHDAEQIRKSLLAWWKGDSFYFAMDAPGKPFLTNWDKWYPDATAQLTPITYGVISPDDPLAKQIWEKFNATHPQWVTDDQPDDFPWTTVGYTAALMGDWERVETYLQAIDTKYGQTGRRWPYHVSASGSYLRTLKAYKAALDAGLIANR